jgi:spore germination protein GerM
MHPTSSVVNRLNPTDWFELIMRPMRTRAIVGLVLVVGVGLGARNLPQKGFSAAAAWWPWNTTTATLYFSDGRFMIPVSRRMTRNDDLPRTTLQALLAGPAAGSGLATAVPAGTEIRFFEIRDRVAHIDFSSAFHGDRDQMLAAQSAIVETMTALPGVTFVSLSVDGKPIDDSARRVPLLYFLGSDGLVAIPTSATTPRGALDAYLSGSPDPALTGLPSDVQLLGYEHGQTDEVLALNFSYPSSVHTLALDHPERMRLLLLGLIASLTEFASVRAVRLDFEGRTRLGLGQCSDLLLTPQPRPELLNDERLLKR